MSTPMMEASTITYSNSSCCSDSFLEARSKDFVIKLLVDEDDTTTIRRIRLFRLADPLGNISFEKLVRLVSSKVGRHFPHPGQDTNMTRLSYLDVDEDCIVVDSTDELVDAIDQFADQRVLRLFVGDITPAMRQAYLESNQPSNNAGLSKRQQQMMNGSEMEHAIERQIEIVLEKRFRMLEQKRREGGGVIAEPPTTATATTATTPRGSSSQSPSPRNNSSPYGRHRPPQSQYSNRLPWEGTDDDLRPPRAPQHQPQQRNESKEYSGITSMNEEERPELYDLTLSSSRNRSLGGNSIARRSQSPLPASPTNNNNNNNNNKHPSINATSPVPPQPLDTRYLVDSKTDITSQLYNNRDDYDDDGDLRDDIDMDHDDEDGLYGLHGPHQHHHLYPHQSHNNEYHNHNDEWEDTNTVDSDAELSLLLSDTDFREADNRDDLTSPKQGGGSVSSVSERQGIAEATHISDINSNDVGPALPNLATSPQTTGTGPHITDTTPTTSANSNKPKSPVAPFNSIPRPTPPIAKKNKLMGILYNSE